MSNIIKTEKGLVFLARNWLEKEEADELLEICDNFEKEQIHNTMYGVTRPVKRLNYACGDSDVKVHRYSNTLSVVHPWNDSIKKIRDRILEETGYYTDACLLNYYRDGEDYLPHHSDKEVHGPGKIVVTVSLGASRKFTFKSKIPKDRYRFKLKDNKPVDWTEYHAVINKMDDGITVDEKSNDVKIILNNGDAVIMFGDIQDRYTHTIPVQKKVKDLRVSLTFRLLKPEALNSKGIKIVKNKYSFSEDFALPLPNDALRH